MSGYVRGSRSGPDRDRPPAVRHSPARHGAELEAPASSGILPELRTPGGLPVHGLAPGELLELLAPRHGFRRRLSHPPA